MRIRISTEQPGWILYRLALEIKNEIKNVDINKPFSNHDINYYINYGYYKEKSSVIDVACFTHYDEKILNDKWIKVANEVDHIVSISNTTKNVLVNQGVPENKITVIMIPADSTFKPLVRLGVCGRVYKGGRKGEHLIEKLLKDKDVNQKIELIANDISWENIGLKNLNIPFNMFYNSIDYLLIPSLNEGGPVPFMEALACGKEAIAPPIGVIPDFPHYEYKVGDYKDMKKTILNVIEPEYKKRKEIAKAVRNYNGWKSWALSHKKLFRELLQK